MEHDPNSYEEIHSYLHTKYKRVTIGKKELAQELDISMSTLNNYISKKMGIPKFKKLGKAKNARVIFTLVDLAKFLSSDSIKTM